MTTRNHGFTLVETTFALALLAISAVAILSGITYAMRQAVYNRDNKQATQILLDKTEIIRLYSLEQVTNLPSSFTNGIYSGTLQIGAVPFEASYSTQLCMVTFTVNWVSTGTPCTRAWSTFVARHGLHNFVKN